MAARKWTNEQRAAQSKAIQEWKPWRYSTGATSATGKATISRNAYRGGTRSLCRFYRWFYLTIAHPERLTPEMVESAELQCTALLSGRSGYLAASITKLITKYGHFFSETEIADLQELARSHEDFKSSLMQ